MMSMATLLKRQHKRRSMQVIPSLNVFTQKHLRTAASTMPHAHMPRSHPPHTLLPQSSSIPSIHGSIIPLPFPANPPPNLSFAKYAGFASINCCPAFCALAASVSSLPEK